MRISHLDGLRGLAILWVIVFHSYSRWFDYHHLLPATKDLSFFKFGYLGVMLFFMISGFVIFMTLDKSTSFLQFMKRRWLRLFPAMLIVTIFIYLTASFFYERPSSLPSLLNTLPGLTFISPDLIEIITGYKLKALEGSFWSLYVEVIFYAVMGFIYFFVGRKYCIPILFALYSTFYITVLAKHFDITKPFELFNILGFQYYNWFIIGCVVYEAINNRNSKFNIAIALIAVALFFLSDLLNPHRNLLLIAYRIAIMILFVASFFSKKMQSMLSIKPLLIIGFASYPLYLVHENILVSSLIKLHKLGINDTAIYLMPILITAVLTAVAYSISKYIEPPIKSALHRIIKP